jgi:hypothetical protein
VRMEAGCKVIYAQAHRHGAKALSPPAGSFLIPPEGRPSRRANTTTVLEYKGPLRRAKTGRALALSAPFWPSS